MHRRATIYNYIYCVIYDKFERILKSIIIYLLVYINFSDFTIIIVYSIYLKMCYIYNYELNINGTIFSENGAID